MKSFRQLVSSWSLSLVIVLLLTSCRNPQHAQWPSIKEISVRQQFAANPTGEQLKTVIYDRRGTPVYCLDARFCWRDYDTDDYDFSGTLDCRLYPLTGHSSNPTLLQNNVNATRDWQTYGRFTREELIGLAGSDASRSIVQRCLVRGMTVEIEVLNVKEKDGGIVSFDMIFTTKNASPGERLEANREIAQLSR